MGNFKTEAELNDTFGGIAAPQDVVAAMESDNADKQVVAETAIRLMYAHVVNVHWVTSSSSPTSSPPWSR